jgi:hypothetical protein
MITYSPISTLLYVCSDAVKRRVEGDCEPAALEPREDSILRSMNGIRDAVVFPRLRAIGVADVDLHVTAMRLVREVQAGRDRDGAIAALLSVVRCGVNGTAAMPEVV